jgi:hypothetical protein
MGWGMLKINAIKKILKVKQLLQKKLELLDDDEETTLAQFNRIYGLN